MRADWKLCVLAATFPIRSGGPSHLFTQHKEKYQFSTRRILSTIKQKTLNDQNTHTETDRRALYSKKTSPRMWNRRLWADGPTSKRRADVRHANGPRHNRNMRATSLLSLSRFRSHDYFIFITNFSSHRVRIWKSGDHLSNNNKENNIKWRQLRRIIWTGRPTTISLVRSQNKYHHSEWKFWNFFVVRRTSLISFWSSEWCLCCSGARHILTSEKGRKQQWKKNESRHTQHTHVIHVEKRKYLLENYFLKRSEFFLWWC